MSTMFVRLITAFALCSCLFLVTSCQSDTMSMGEKRASSKFCGKYLSNALQLVCNGVYNVMFKKSSTGELADADNEPYWLPEIEEIQFPFRTKSGAKALLTGPFRRQKRGVYDECCRKSCTMKEMSSYCGRR